ncbi:MAG: family 1 glycosylhydrolase [Chloroflexi bacterium]|nr:family 1 glycosylhydrolase [Chloroflexota bacterium]
MPHASFHFPPGFLWGTATAAHQVEGNNTNNNWWDWEQQEGRIVQGQKSGLADDWWGGRWREDFDRAAESGQNAHRMSVEWSRIQPAPDRWDEHALDHYREMVRGLVSRGMTPMITLHHFTDPLWLMERGGWEDAGTPALFAAFAGRVVEALKEYVNLWVTINEPNVYAYIGYLEGAFPPGKHDLNAAFRVMTNLARGHGLAYKTIHGQQKQAQVGLAQNYRSFQPARSWLPLDVWAARLQHNLFNNSMVKAVTAGKMDLLTSHFRLPEAAHTLDFLGVNYYTRDMVAFSLGAASQGFSLRSLPSDRAISENRFIASVPEGMFEALKWGRAFGAPMMVTENGVEDSTDALRPRYIIEHIHQIWRAVNFNWPVNGYFHWSLVDNFEWERGWTQRFGLWGLDTSTQARKKRSSADLYAEICRLNGIDDAMVQKYAPEALPGLFPG